ncbi:MAG TPA: hypothetical protein VFV38_08500 [Ktedonobacteraceae bacterium]|nr:hypothetical protein [Ktedonobacteraceae bacterium]
MAIAWPHPPWQVLDICTWLVAHTVTLLKKGRQREATLSVHEEEQVRLFVEVSHLRTWEDPA